jgi:hypothetical protein
MKYLILIYANPQSREIWESMPDEQKAEGYRYYGELDAELGESRELIVSEALASPRESLVVTAREGQEPIVTDGPFAESTPHLAGFFLVDCHGPQRAVEIATRIPQATCGLVEVRPVLDLGAVLEREPA